MRVLLTRPRADSERSAAELARHGHSAIVSPILEIRRSAAKPDIEGVGAIALTSANAVEGAARVEAARVLPVFAVGGRTAEAARRAGFQIAGVAAGSAESLVRTIAASWKPGRGEILHLSGREVRGDLVGKLKALGFQAKRQVVYEAHPIHEIPAEARTALQRGEVDAAMFFSPRTAGHFSALADRAGLSPSLAPVDAVCLSRAVARSLTRSDWNHIVVAPHRELSSMIEALDRLGRGANDEKCQ